MSFKSLSTAIADMPSGMRESVLNYARAVQYAAPDIFRDAGRSYTKDVADQLVFLAGVKKLFSILDSTYWMLDNSSAILSRHNVDHIKVGSSSLAQGSDEHQKLNEMREIMIDILKQHKIYELVRERSYSNIIKELLNEHRSD